MRTVYAYVCGDILHRGHLAFLNNAKAFGDLLIVGVLADKAVMERKQQPVIPFDDRFDLVAALKPVDVVVPQESYSPIENIHRLRPDILAESANHNPSEVYKAEQAMLSRGGRVVILPYYPERSSTEIKDRIREQNDE